MGDVMANNGEGSERIDLYGAFPEGAKAINAMERAVRESGLEHSLIELVKMRASQINGCAYCIDMHSKDARAAGETEQRLYGLNAWRETPFYTERERAALALTESVTLVSVDHVPDEVVHEAQSHFSPEDFSRLVFAIVTINVWNRLAITGRAPVGSYQPDTASRPAG
jgi:AhpD family alkylhydroperoxidase